MCVCIWCCAVIIETILRGGFEIIACVCEVSICHHEPEALQLLFQASANSVCQIYNSHRYKYFQATYTKRKKEMVKMGTILNLWTDEILGGLQWEDISLSAILLPAWHY